MNINTAILIDLHENGQILLTATLSDSLFL